MSDTDTDTDTTTENTTEDAPDYDKILSDLETDRDSWKTRATQAEINLTELQQRADAAEAALREAQEAAQNAAQTAQETTEPDPAVDDEAPEATEAQAANQDRRGVRQRLADAEAERDALRETLARQQQTIYEHALESVSVTGMLMAAAGHTVDAFVGDDGVVHPADVAQAAVSASAAAGIPRRPAPDPMVGRSRNNSHAPVTFGTLLQAAVQDAAGRQ